LAEYIPNDFPTMSQSLPEESQQLSKFITEARSAKTKKTDALDRFRATLLKERRAGAPVRAIAEGLGKIGVIVSEETLRTWLIAHSDPKKQLEAKAQIETPRRQQQLSTIARPSATTSSVVVSSSRNIGPRVARADI
jgi:hypothetical protein